MENLKGRDYLRGLGIDGRVINYYIGSKGVDWQERSNEPSGSVTGRQFLDQLNHSFLRGTFLHGVRDEINALETATGRAHYRCWCLN
jgi:hypothetical protein